jgi:hypothetical protein
MTERIEPGKPAGGQTPSATTRRAWHTPEFRTLDVWSTEAKAGTPSDGKPTQS